MRPRDGSMLEVGAARHVIDAVPFSLWDAQDREFRPPDESQWEWLFEKFNAQTISLRSWYMWIETDKPSQSIPLTIACKPVMFVGTGAQFDIALVKLHPAASARFTNECNFQAKPPRSLRLGDLMEAGSWSEVDGMSSGLISMITVGRYFEKPQHFSNHSPVPFERWRSSSVNTVFGAINPTITEGIRGASIVDIESGGVGGLFHLFNGLECISAHLDDLIAEGWEVV
ncbi:hypothetical protein POX_c03725 [Penicillium oxalicum]|uniref:hypothetical protein n=1 Tax=Penicillium oxalicum TaxID=69781 RepID=UPI0020B68AF9|nr:hypothetical protein POX_c03725 [Penicillium oxalicum]KAI2790874.1 hypothetical protein POX_c03725 [Penicillium oxalicum]